MISKYIDLKSVFDLNSLKLLLYIDESIIYNIATKYGATVLYSESHIPLYITNDDGSWYHYYPSNFDKLIYSEPQYDDLIGNDEYFTCFYIERFDWENHENHHIILFSDQITTEKMINIIREIIKTKKLLTFA